MPDASQPSPGILVLNKPVGPSSMRAVSIVRRTLGGIKTGHAGTLDPLADGVLVLACGKPATKSIPHFMGTDKRYRTKIDLRAFTATDDTQAEAELVPVDVPPTEAAIDSVLEKYVGTIMQAPPVFSAIRVNGKRAYAEARAGRTPEMVARPIQVHRIHRVGGGWPVVELEIHCEKGFYVRSLARDLGVQLGTGGHCLSITRTAVGPFVLKDAVALDPLPDDLAKCLIPLEHALRLVGADQDNIS